MKNPLLGLCWMLGCITSCSGAPFVPGAEASDGTLVLSRDGRAPDARAPGSGDAGAGCTGSIPPSPDARGNGANIAQGGSVMMGSHCGGVSESETAPHAFDNSVQTKWLCY